MPKQLSNGSSYESAHVAYGAFGGGKTSPVNWFALTAMSVSAVMVASSVGSDPCSKLDDKNNDVSLVRRAMSVGIVPIIFCVPKSNHRNCVNEPIDAGIEPLERQSNRLSQLSAVSADMSGICPTAPKRCDK